MPGLIQRYNTVAEYSALVSTNPSATQVRGRRLRRDVDYVPQSTRAAISDEAADWYEAVCPPLEEVQDVIRRFHADPDFSQDRVFAFLAPIVTFGALFVVAVIAVQPHSFAHRILDDPTTHTADILWVFGLLSGGLFLGLVMLKCSIRGIADLASIILTLETREERGRREREGIPSTDLVLGGIFM